MNRLLRKIKNMFSRDTVKILKMTLIVCTVLALQVVVIYMILELIFPKSTGYIIATIALVVMSFVSSIASKAVKEKDQGLTPLGNTSSVSYELVSQGTVFNTIGFVCIDGKEYQVKLMNVMLEPAPDIDTLKKALNED